MKVYVVMGKCGTYEVDHWSVCAFIDEKKAEVYAEKATKEYKMWRYYEKVMGIDLWYNEYRSRYDPEFWISGLSGDVSYSVQELEVKDYEDVKK